MEIYSIGFTKRSAESFFEALREAEIEVLMDVRLRNESQLAGFTKKDDLAYFLRRLLHADYVHEQRLAPTEELLSAYRKRQIKWDEYETRFRSLIEERRIEKVLEKRIFERRTCLLCSEFTATHCHRRLVIEYLAEKWGNVKAVHL